MLLLPIRACCRLELGWQSTLIADNLEKKSDEAFWPS